VDASHSYRDIM